MDAAAIETRELTKTYNNGKLRAVDGVSLAIRQGEVFGLIGPNGAGKSTLIGLLLGLLRATSGEIRIFGRSPFERGIRRVTGYLPERPQFDAWMTVRQFLRYHHMLAGLPDSRAKQDTERVLNRVGLTDEVAGRSIRKLSRGLLQRVGLAQALLGEPMLCFLDEPDSGMDPLGTQLVRGIILELKARGCTVLVNSHHLDQVERTCDRVAFISRGSIRSIHDLQDGALAENFRTMRFTFGELANGNLQKVADIAEAAGARVLEINGLVARVSLPEQLPASTLIKQLVLNDLLCEEAVVERRSLEELFAEVAGEQEKQQA
jgi:ABC-2 type transport system ATP-binding protein